MKKMKITNHLVSMATLCLILSTMLTGCYSVKKTVENSLPLSQEINWPEDYDPEDSKFFVHNEIDIEASPETVWEILINAVEWETYYEGASEFELAGNSDGKLKSDSEFSWKTMGLDFTSVIKEYEAPNRLAWESIRKDIRGYHAWLILPTPTGSKLITSEAQHGFMTLPQKVFIPKKLKGLHDIWLAEIKTKAENTEK